MGGIATLADYIGNATFGFDRVPSWTHDFDRYLRDQSARSVQNEAMTLSGEQWLEQVLRPEVAGARRIRDGPDSGALVADALWWLGGRLAAQVEALAMRYAPRGGP